MSETIRVGIADMNICKSPDKITTIGLGSCVGVVLYNAQLKVAGLVHIMLPDSTKINQNQNKLKFADTGIECLVAELEKRGIYRASLKAKIAGGARMFNFNVSSDIGSVGDKNVMAVRAKLAEYGIKIVSEDVGLNYGRTIVFDPETSELLIVTAGKQSKSI